MAFFFQVSSDLYEILATWNEIKWTALFVVFKLEVICDFYFFTKWYHSRAGISFLVIVHVALVKINLKLFLMFYFLLQNVVVILFWVISKVMVSHVLVIKCVRLFYIHVQMYMYVFLQEVSLQICTQQYKCSYMYSHFQTNQ